MRKKVIYLALLVIWCISLFGCGSTFMGVKEDIKNNWSVLTGWSQKFRENIGKKYDFEITDVEVRMTGLCSSCRSQGNETASDRS